MRERLRKRQARRQERRVEHAPRASVEAARWGGYSRGGSQDSGPRPFDVASETPDYSLGRAKKPGGCLFDRHLGIGGTTTVLIGLDHVLRRHCARRRRDRHRHRERVLGRLRRRHRDEDVQVRDRGGDHPVASLPRRPSTLGAPHERTWTRKVAMTAVIDDDGRELEVAVAGPVRDREPGQYEAFRPGHAAFVIYNSILDTAPRSRSRRSARHRCTGDAAPQLKGSHPCLRNILFHPASARRPRPAR